MFAIPVSRAGVSICIPCSASSTQDVQGGVWVQGRDFSSPARGGSSHSSDFRLLGFAPGWVPLKPLEPLLMQTSAFPKQTQAAYPALPSRPRHPLRLLAFKPCALADGAVDAGASRTRQDFPVFCGAGVKNKVNKTLETKCPAHSPSKPRPWWPDGSVSLQISLCWGSPVCGLFSLTSRSITCP